MASPPMADDAEFVLLAQESPWAFEHLYRRYVDSVHRYCYRRLGSREAAEDATSQIFTKAFAALPTLRAGSFRSWLFTIAYHVIADDLRARRPHADFALVSEVAAHDPSPEERAIANDEYRSVAVLLEQLPLLQRQVVELRLAGLNGREIAEVLGRSLPAVKMAQLRAYARLREMLAADPQEARDDQR
jgi:RNA polymerase sigma-70 factor (ECF subfamily)